MRLSSPDSAENIYTGFATVMPLESYREKGRKSHRAGSITNYY